MIRPVIPTGSLDVRMISGRRASSSGRSNSSSDPVASRVALTTVSICSLDSPVGMLLRVSFGRRSTSVDLNRVITFMRDADERVARPECEDDFRRTGTARKPW